VESRTTSAAEGRRTAAAALLPSKHDEEQAVKQSYAVLWSRNGDTSSGRLDPLEDGFELHGREGGLSIPFTALAGAAILRAPADRLRGLPVLALRLRNGDPVRIASLEGAAVLHEIADRVENHGFVVAA
jgi:hypothetical protein